MAAALLMSRTTLLAKLARLSDDKVIKGYDRNQRKQWSISINEPSMCTPRLVPDLDQMDTGTGIQSVPDAENLVSDLDQPGIQSVPALVSDLYQSGIQSVPSTEVTPRRLSHEGNPLKVRAKRKVGRRPKSLEEVRAYFEAKGVAQIHADAFFHNKTAIDWVQGRGNTAIKNWQSAAIYWISQIGSFGQYQTTPTVAEQPPPEELEARKKSARAAAANSEAGHSRREGYSGARPVGELIKPKR